MKSEDFASNPQSVTNSNHEHIHVYLLTNIKALVCILHHLRSVPREADILIITSFFLKHFDSAYVDTETLEFKGPRPRWFSTWECLAFESKPPGFRILICRMKTRCSPRLLQLKKKALQK